MRRCSSARGAFLFFLAAAACAEDLAVGRVTEKVVCREQPAQSYALYLPPAYTADKRWPILYLLDARGRALLPVERFREAAATYGWILASSYDSRSDTKDDPNTPALQAMWRDTHARLAIDERRAYLAGFSGGARASVAIALAAPKAIAGVIGCGAGLHDDRVSLDGTALPLLRDRRRPRLQLLRDARPRGPPRGSEGARPGRGTSREATTGRRPISRPRRSRGWRPKP